MTSHKKQPQHTNQTPRKGTIKKHHDKCNKWLKKDEEASNQSTCDCLIDEQDDQVNEIVSPIIIKPTINNTIDSNVLSPNSLSAASSLIFERNVQDQITNCCCTTVTSTSTATGDGRSRRNSQNLLARSQSYSSQSAIPTHLNSEFFVPQVLDATTEVLTDPNYNENVEVIQSTANSNLSSSLLATDPSSSNHHSSTSSSSGRPAMGNRRMSRSLPISRRQSTSYAPLSPISTTSTTAHNNNVHNNNENSCNNNNSTSNEVDYSDQKKLNFYSFADLLSDETGCSDVVMMSPTSPKSATGTTTTTSDPTGAAQKLRDPFNKDHVFVQPPVVQQLGQHHGNSMSGSNVTFPSLSKTSSIKEILLENQSELDRSVL